MIQANQAPTTKAPIQTIYLPIVWDATCNRVPLDDLSRDGCIDIVMTGELGNVIKIIASDQATGRCWDCTQEIAREAVAQAADRYGVRDIPRACLEFAEDVLGAMTTRALTLAAA